MYKVGLYMEVIHIECHGGDYACGGLCTGWGAGYYLQGETIHRGYTQCGMERTIHKGGAIHSLQKPVRFLFNSQRLS